MLWRRHEVSALWPMPSGRMTHIRLQRPRGPIAENAIRCPSGDQAGSVWTALGTCVIRWSFAPALVITQWLQLDALHRLKAICVPSGDQAGSLSSLGSVVNRTTPDPLAVIA